MKRAESAYWAACAAATAGALAYLLSDFGGWPKLIYEPYRDAWTFASEPPSPAAMVYPGMVIWGLAAALVAGAATLAIAPRLPEDWRRGGWPLMAGWAGAMSVFGALYFLWGLWPF